MAFRQRKQKVNILFGIYLTPQDIVIPPSYDSLLPECKGPKLHPFKDRAADVEFVQLLSSSVDDSSNGSVGQSHVFGVTIASQPYALKMVNSALSEATQYVLTPFHDFSLNIMT